MGMCLFACLFPKLVTIFRSNFILATYVRSCWIGFSLVITDKVSFFFRKYYRPTMPFSKLAELQEIKDPIGIYSFHFKHLMMLHM